MIATNKTMRGFKERIYSDKFHLWDNFIFTAGNAHHDLLLTHSNSKASYHSKRGSEAAA